MFFIDRLIEYMGWSKTQNAEMQSALHEMGGEFGGHHRGLFGAYF